MKRILFHTISTLARVPSQFNSDDLYTNYILLLMLRLSLLTPCIQEIICLIQNVVYFFFFFFLRNLCVRFLDARIPIIFFTFQKKLSNFLCFLQPFGPVWEQCLNNENYYLNTTTHPHTFSPTYISTKLKQRY